MIDRIKKTTFIGRSSTKSPRRTPRAVELLANEQTPSNPNSKLFLGLEDKLQWKENGKIILLSRPPHDHARTTRSSKIAGASHQALHHTALGPSSLSELPSLSPPDGRDTDLAVLLAQHSKAKDKAGDELAGVEHAKPGPDAEESALVPRARGADGGVGPSGLVGRGGRAAGRAGLEVGLGEGHVLAGVLEVVGLDVVGEVEEDGEGDGEQGHDHDRDADEVVGPGEVGCRLEGGGVDGAEDPVDELESKVIC